jgi:hypothetical protein
VWVLIRLSSYVLWINNSRWLWMSILTILMVHWLTLSWFFFGIACISIQYKNHSKLSPWGSIHLLHLSCDHWKNHWNSSKSYLLEMAGYILFSVLGIKSFPLHIHFYLQNDKNIIHSESWWLMGAADFSNPFPAKEVFKQLMQYMQVHCCATKTSSCFRRSLVWPFEFFAAVIPSPPNKIRDLQVFLLEYILC